MKTQSELISVRVDTLTMADMRALSDRFDRAADDPRFGSPQRRFFGDLSDALTERGSVRQTVKPPENLDHAISETARSRHVSLRTAKPSQDQATSGE